MRVLGLMSGTSADGVDAVLVDFRAPVHRPRWRLLSRATLAYPPELRHSLIAFGQGATCCAADILELAEAVTEVQAAAARACDPGGQAELVGCHGQTVWHRPPGPERRGSSWQLLQAPLLAGLLGRPVVHDFRAADLVLGGQGAPLVCPADEALVGRIAGWRAVLNLGGIANLTLIPPGCGPERHQLLQGWDCGPANTLVDLAVERFSGGELTYDADGAWARQGQVNDAAIQGWLQEPYFQQVPPKSTGRELFGRADLDRRLQDLAAAEVAAGRAGEVAPATALATLTAFTAAVVAHDLQRCPRPVELLVAGGGARNRFLLDQLRHRCRGMVVRPLADLGIADSDREALGFALLAWWHHCGQPGNAASVTGARAATVLGMRADPPGRAEPRARRT
ncbi:anhydro-N-acetylmuramic acid kinase [Cyanobium sp. NIES-981]|uniref:anhydro-N-acetylmuramic acid kinase n=1 Tax=Cyanobium sp. NIES-981 TaxID=1851505 RepID=UPI0007DCC8B1|nr:anhydro-N-acetylmuramic acid kinase [Cyanobium sp. NIES-981]SBO44763.1 Anhydro-N-acetylmuramic acid kinase [Cyanobium sp. NIES-981]